METHREAIKQREHAIEALKMASPLGKRRRNGTRCPDCKMTFVRKRDLISHWRKKCIFRHEREESEADFLRRADRLPESWDSLRPNESSRRGYHSPIGRSAEPPQLDTTEIQRLGDGGDESPLARNAFAIRTNTPCTYLY